MAPNVEVAGQSWPDFDLDETIVITAVDPVDEFAVDDVITDEIVFRQPGTPASAATLSPTVVESGQDPSPTAGGTIATPTAGPATDPTPTVEAVPEITPGGVIDTRDYCAAFVEWSDNYDALEDGGASDAELYDYANAAYRDLATISPTPEVRNAGSTSPA